METDSTIGCGSDVCHLVTFLHVAKKRATITSELAQEIFLIRTMPEVEEGEQGIFAYPRMDRSAVMSKIYGISPKAIRDVWNRSVKR